MQHILVLLNADAGTLLDRDAAQIRTLVEHGFGGGNRKVEVQLLSAKKLAHAIGEAGKGPHDTVIIGGGDGSVSLAIRSLHGSDKVLGILPLGTMNLLARDMGVPLVLDQAVAALANGEPAAIDLATLNGQLLHTISGLGFFSQMARAREAARHWHLWRFFAVLIAALIALRRMGRFHLQVTVDGETRDFDAFAALVTVNRFSGPGWSRSRLDEGVLEVHIAEDRGALAKLKAGADMMTDSWRDNPGIITLTGRKIVLERRARRRVWVSTDGELGREDLPLSYHILPGALKALLPRPPDPS